jgi:Flp pilus assembly protein protease CpaA
LGALISGALLFFIILAPISEMDRTRLDNPSGMGLVGLAGLILLFLFNRRLKRNEQNIPDRDE